jgi:hypothetical protein
MPSNAVFVPLPFGFSLVRTMQPAQPSRPQAVVAPNRLLAAARGALHFFGDARLAWATAGELSPSPGEDEPATDSRRA